MTTSYDMATPHAPIAILLLHLQALYNIIILTFVISMSLFPGRHGVAVALLRLLREVGEGVESVDRREGVGQGGGSITTPKQGVAIEAWWQRGSLKSPTKINDPLCEVKYGASSGGLPNDRLIYRFN